MPGKICIYENCNRRANFNYPNEKAMYCNSHKLENMTDVTHKRCIFENCDTQSTYNYENEKTPIYCKEHKMENMINIKNKRICINYNCNKIPIYNYENEKKPIYCNDHKLDNMINIVDKKCIFENCNTQPCYNYPNEKTPLYCNLHKLSNMENITENRKCIFENCNTRPHYNYPNEKKALYCNIHKLKNMENIISKRCLFENCNTRPIYNYQNKKKAIYCNSHKKQNMINIKDKKCTSCNLFIVVKKNNYLCSYCNPIKSQRIKTKELAIKALLEFHKISFIHDKQITNECCLKYRPDFLIDCNSYYIVVEVDEDAHNQYDKECEIIRMNNIITSIGLPAKFIRYNPDKKGISKKVKEQKLIEVLREEMNKEYIEILEPIYLFY